MATRRWRSAGNEGAAGSRRRRCSLGRWSLPSRSQNRGTHEGRGEGHAPRQAEEVLALLERRGLLANACRAVDARVPATGLPYVAAVAPVGGTGVRRVDGARLLVRTAPYAVLGRGICSCSLAKILIAGASIA